ncbi:MAG: TRAM domain-containing protein, partial [Gammaproteobacteria bacterium]
RGVARLEGKVVFVRNALPGERVLAKLTYGKRHFFEATAVEILEASSERVTPPCAHANVCGGCSLQHWRSDKQIEQKQAVLAEQLQHFGGLMPEQGFLPPLLGPTEQYRRKARLACKYVRARERVFVGFREAASHYVTDVSACAVLDERVSRLLPALSVMMTGLPEWARFAGAGSAFAQASVLTFGDAHTGIGFDVFLSSFGLFTS